MHNKVFSAQSGVLKNLSLAQLAKHKNSITEKVTQNFAELISQSANAVNTSPVDKATGLGAGVDNSSASELVKSKKVQKQAGQSRLMHKLLGHADKSIARSITGRKLQKDIELEQNTSLDSMDTLAQNTNARQKKKLSNIRSTRNSSKSPANSSKVNPSFVKKEESVSPQKKNFSSEKDITIQKNIEQAPGIQYDFGARPSSIASSLKLVASSQMERRQSKRLEKNIENKAAGLGKSLQKKPVSQYDFSVAQKQKLSPKEKGSQAKFLTEPFSTASNKEASLKNNTGLSSAHSFSEKYASQSLEQNFAMYKGSELGLLVARFESGEEGIEAIGYDANGGTSYGKFQISSRAGSMKRFISYLEEHAPDMATKLVQAGPANTGSTRGKMPQVWKQIAQEEPERFEALQNDFVKKNHFEPALQGIAENTGVAFAHLPVALQEVVFSTAVQHGVNGAVRIIKRALGAQPAQFVQDKIDSFDDLLAKGQDLIKRIYAIREGQFKSSTPYVQNAVKKRLRAERDEALSMLQQNLTQA